MLLQHFFDKIAAGSTATSMMSVLGGGTTLAGGIVATCQSIRAVGAISNTAAAAWGCVGAATGYFSSGNLPEQVINALDASTSVDDFITDRFAMTDNWSRRSFWDTLAQVRENTSLRTVASGLAVGAVAIVGAPVAVKALGFTSAGIAAGSTAASMMSVLGGGTTSGGGIVATCQSIGAVGAISNTAAAAWGCVGAATDYFSIGNLPEQVINALDASTSVDDLVTDRFAMTDNWSRRSFWDTLAQVRENTSLRTVASGLAVGAVASVGAPIAVKALGFTSAGIAVGSTAASMMSVLGGGATSAGGIVATCQSIGAVGAISNTAAAAWGCVGAATDYFS